MKTSLFDYDLPRELIAQKSVSPRDHSRLMVLDRKHKTIEHHRFFEIGDFLRSGDLLVVNNTKVFKARLLGTVRGGDGKQKPIEIFLLNAIETQPRGATSGGATSRNNAGGATSRNNGRVWHCLGKPGKRLHPGVEIRFGRVHSRVILKGEQGELTVEFFGVSDVVRWANRVGHIPIPPYVAHEPKKIEAYQTVYAKHTGSVAAPTAGFHFTPRLIRALKKKGIGFASVTLHVGMGTFRPMVTDTLEDHVMHEEYAEVPTKTARVIAETKKRGGRVIAVGTTTVRALEGLLLPPPGCGMRTGMVNLFINPGYHFKVIDGLITNFHLPRSTLLVLVSAFAGRSFMLKSYREAVRKKYRFYSFGDAQLIVNE